MPYSVSKESYEIDPRLPQNLSHKPLYAIPYAPFDGLHADNTDAMFLSVGLSQWDRSEVSAKVMRFSGHQWSPQSEELPLHRPIDLTILIAKSLFDAENGNLRFPGGVFQGQGNCISVTQEACSVSQQDVFEKYVAEQGQTIKDRLNSLCDVLTDLRRRGKI